MFHINIEDRATGRVTEGALVCARHLHQAEDEINRRLDARVQFVSEHADPHKFECAICNRKGKEEVDHR